MKFHLPLAALLLLSPLCLALPLVAQDEDSDDAPAAGLRGSLIEDRAARKLLEAGDARLEADEVPKAIEVWQSVIERYPRSRVRFEAHMRLGDHFLERERAHDRARVHFQAAASEENRDEEQRAEAMLKTGVCFYQARNYGRSFQAMRDVIEAFPISPQVNEAHYYIGLAHFQLGHYSRAIAALEKVGTTLSGEPGKVEKVEAGKRLFVKIEDADLAALEPGQTIEVRCETASGDSEIIECYPVGRNVRVVLGSILTQLGTASPYNGVLELRGDDTVKVTYIDQHTADKEFDRPVVRDVMVVGNAVASVMDGAFSETLRGVVLGKSVNVQVVDADRDLSENADRLTAVVEIYRHKTDEEIEEETAAAIAAGHASENGSLDDPDAEGPKIDRFKQIDRLEVELVEVPVEREAPRFRARDDDDDADDGRSLSAGELSAAVESLSESSQTAHDGPVHSGVFRGTVSLVKSETADDGDDMLQALPGDIVRVTYLDEKHTGDGVRTVTTEARAVEGNLGGVRVTRAVISDQELRIQTQLRTASALTSIGNRYKEFGLKINADSKYEQALHVCEEIMDDARRIGGRLLEETYVQLWKIYYEMDNLNLAAAMAQRLQNEFPNSGFVDEALLQLADIARKQGNMQRAIGIYTRLVSMPKSELRGEAQFGIAQCYEAMADAAPEQSAAQLYDRSFQEYKKVFDNHPNSGRVGEAVAKMANYYYQQQDYGRAVDTFETVLTSYPDAKFLDVILFNYGRCLYRMNRRDSARQKFDQLISDFPESPLAADAKKISDALVKSGF